MKRRFGPQGPKPVAKTDLFWRHVEKADGCWIWHGATTKFGYGQIKSAQKKYAAHRLSWEIHNGREIPHGYHVCHRCDNPRCTNPDHLFIGTPKDNIRDAMRKGRMRTRPVLGVDHPNSKLTEDAVRAIRLDQRSLPQIAREYGVSHVLIGKVKRREIWKHIP